ncbi:SusD family protein [Mucilaginibacter pineti]|uniref:SusD family protein n=1 Tax=Mucilaginibacter pineti TaxID=1391627 RepID=A0A1G6UB11_9SPHI|nr:RagB/SusD family nutrient uptake outer membrane protein [Mucilaginibacter pineti]SDD38580.1 SusD family protein [Mucilaginibacter pineti]
MKQKNIKYLVIVFVSCFLWSCKKELNVFPTTSEVDGNVIVDAKSAFTVLNGVYYRFANAGADNNTIPSVRWCDVSESLPSEMANTLVIPGGGDNFNEFTFDSKSYGVDGIWNYGYALVNAANGFLKNVAPITTIPAATKKQMIAEAKFLRAYGNEYLLLFYGEYHDVNSKFGIILRDEFITTDNINVARSTVAATYTSILSDLDAAIPDLPAQNTKTFYANITAAKILKARVLINRGIAGDYAQVATLTDDVINAKTFELEPSVKDLFLSNGLTSKEVVMNVQPFATENYKFQNYQYYQQYVLTDSLKSMLTGDPRAEWMYKDYTSRYYGVIPEFTKYYSGDVKNIQQTPLSENCYAFRITEAYLLEAEALALLNGDLTKAKTLLTTIMNRAGITDVSAVINAKTGEELQLLVVKEEMKNFIGENGGDWFALRRLPFATVKKIQPAITAATQLILPIPNIERVTNGKVDQNPGYAN